MTCCGRPRPSCADFHAFRPSPFNGRRVSDERKTSSWAYRRMRLAAAQALEEGADLVARLFPPHHAGVRHPVELDDTPRTIERLETVPGVGLVLEHEQCSLVRRHFGNDVIEIVGRTQ